MSAIVTIGAVVMEQSWPHRPACRRAAPHARGFLDIATEQPSPAYVRLVIERLLYEHRYAWSGSVLPALVADEQAGWLNGSRFLLANGQIDADAWVIGEMTRNRVAIAEKGLFWVRLETLGRTATPENGVSAIEKMLDLLVRIRSELVPTLSFRSHPLTSPASLNIGLLEGGVQPNVVLDSCSAVLDGRLLTNEQPGDFEQDLRRLISDQSRRDPDFHARMETLVVGSLLETDRREPLVRVALAACEAAGVSGEAIGFDQASDGRFSPRLACRP